MSHLSFNTMVKGVLSDKDVLSVFQRQSAKSNTIQQGMSAKEIADIVSDEVVKEVRKQFAKTKEQFLAKKGK